MTIIKDQLSWEEFYRVSKGLKSNPKKVTAFNRLIAHSKNFFIISGYGAFTPGYTLIITKDFIPSYGLVENTKLEVLFGKVGLYSMFRLIVKIRPKSTVE